MKLNHINLCVNNVVEMSTFMQTYFGFRCLADKEQEMLVVLADDTNSILALNNFERASEISYPKGFHIGFFQNSREQVDRIFERLERDGFELQPRHSAHGAWTFYFQSPAGFVIEVAHQPGIGQQ